jgi:hypothetical protein
MQPFKLGPKQYVHQIGLPIHFGYQGVVTGDAANVLPPLVGDPNVSIHVAKAFTCNVRPGRRSGAHESATWLPVPETEQTPLGKPQRPGPMRAAPGVASTQSDIISGQTIMDGARRVHEIGEERLR